MRILGFWLAVCMALAGLAQAGESGDWGAYANARYGTSIDYPADLFTAQPAPENGDGRSFAGPQGKVSFMVYGSYNVMELPLGGLMTEDMSNPQYDEITYRKWTRAGMCCPVTRAMTFSIARSS